MAYTVSKDPTNLWEVWSSLDANFWQDAINDNIDSLEINKTWNLVDLSSDCKQINCKLILEKTLKSDGTIDNYKALIVARGFRQRENIDLFDTFFWSQELHPLEY